MLILTRKSGEMITIGEDIQIRVLGVKGGQVRIGVNAPRDVAINREEIVERVQSVEGISSAAACLEPDVE